MGPLIRWLVLLGLGVGAAAAAAAAGDARFEAAQVAALRDQAMAHEHGSGTPRDGTRAAALYCEAARLGDATSQFDLGWMYAHGRGVARDDARAGFFFGLAAAQGLVQAETMRRLVGPALVEQPECMREPEPAPLVAGEPVGPAPTPIPIPVEVPIAAPARIAELVTRIAPQFSVPPRLVLAIIQAESNFDSAAVSPKNAQGLMQLIPETAQRFQVKNVFDPAQNVRGGVAYLRWLLAFFEGDVALVAAAYNAGERAVERHRGVPPFAETQAYVRRILSVMGPLAQPYDASVVKASAHLGQMRERPRLR